MLRAGVPAAASAIAALLGLLVAATGAVSAAIVVLLTALGLALYARHWLQLAGRCRVGARSEDEVRSALAPLAEGVAGVLDQPVDPVPLYGALDQPLRHSLPGRGRGVIDSLAIAPTGVAYVVETKTRTCDDRHLARVHEQAAWLARRRWRWGRRGAVAVACLPRPRGIERIGQVVRVVSIDRLVPVLRSGIGIDQIAAEGHGYVFTAGGGCCDRG